MEKKTEEVDLGDNNIEDISWLCSLSESELDLLISLKKLALKRASVIGHVQFAKKLDLKMLRALGSILMQCLKEKVKDESTSFLDSSNLLKSKLDEVMTIEEINECIAFNTRKEFLKRMRGNDSVGSSSSSKRLKTAKDDDEDEEEDSVVRSSNDDEDEDEEEDSVVRSSNDDEDEDEEEET